MDQIFALRRLVVLVNIVFHYASDVVQNVKVIS